MPVVEEQGGLRAGDAFHDAGLGGATGRHHPRLAAEDVEQLEAEGLAGLFFGRKDVEVRSGREVIVTVGVDYPEDEDSKLMAGADEMLADELGHGIECLADGRLFRRLRSGIRCGSRRGFIGNNGIGDDTRAGGWGLRRRCAVGIRSGMACGALLERGGFGELGLEDIFFVGGFHVRISPLLFLLQAGDGFRGQGRSGAGMGIRTTEPPGYFGYGA